ncbi:MAG: porin [Thermoanaerobaculia bacterium]|jgi:phosphate-selective porin
MIRRILALTALTCALSSPVARADDQPPASVEERLRRLEEGYDQLRKVNEALLLENANLRKQLDTVSADVKQPVVTPAGKSAKLQFGGFVQVQGEAGDAVTGRFIDENDRIFVRRARIGMGGNFTEKVDYRLEGEFAGSLGASSAMRAQMTDGYITFLTSPALMIRAGQFKTPYGYEQLYSDTKLMTPERSTVNDFLTVGRQLGVQLAGDLASKRVGYAIGAFNGNASNTSVNDDDSFMIAARLSSYLVGDAAAPRNLRLGVNGYTSDDTSVAIPPVFGVDSTPGSPARDNIFAGNRTAWGVDTQFVSGRTELWAEYLSTELEPDDKLPRDRFTASGWYAQAGYFAIPSTLQLVGKYEWSEPSDEVANDDFDVYWLGANWYLKSHDIKLQLFYALDDGAGADGSGRIIARVQTIF